MMGSQRKTEENLLIADVVVRPNLSKYRMISAFNLADELIEIGYKAMREQVQVLKQEFL